LAPACAIYDQYRDENGVLRDNVRADRIARYQADASVTVTIRDAAAARTHRPRLRRLCAELTGHA